MSGNGKPLDIFQDSTKTTISGRNPEGNFGIVNPPVYHASTILYPDAAALEAHDQKYSYGRRGTPTIDALEDAITQIGGGYGTRLTPSGLAAISTALLSFAEAGDHILVTDSVYEPTRKFCDGILKRLGVETEYYDPLAGAAIAGKLRPNTRLVFTESPGSQTFEMQDIPAIANAAHEQGVLVFTDNTWASPLYFKAFDHGVDVSIQAATKYIVGHSDVMMGSITTTRACWPQLYDSHNAMGQTAGPDDIYLALRGLRTLDVRLERHMKNAITIAKWLEKRPEVLQILHPALPSHPGHNIWKRDFAGASGLFSLILKPCSKTARNTFLNTLTLFGMGYSWGGFESLVIPFDPANYRTATQWPSNGQALRFHIGLEAVEDLKADLSNAFDEMAKTRLSPHP